MLPSAKGKTDKTTVAATEVPGKNGVYVVKDAYSGRYEFFDRDEKSPAQPKAAVDRRDGRGTPDKK